MAKTVFLSTAMLVLACGYAVTARGQEPPGPSATVWDKVYTAEQATRGKDAYMTECSACHSEDLGGSGYAPALVGDGFTFAWNDKTVGDLFERIRKLMPPGDPGGLTPDRYRDIIAFVLQQNKYPDGDRELSSDAPAMKQIRISAPK